jgi:hypothetical protein
MNSPRRGAKTNSAASYGMLTLTVPEGRSRKACILTTAAAISAKVGASFGRRDAARRAVEEPDAKPFAFDELLARIEALGRRSWIRLMRASSRSATSPLIAVAAPSF